MFNLNLYLIIGIAFVALAGGFYFYYRTSEAEKAVLIAANAKLEEAVKTQEEAIKTLKEHTERLATANLALTNSLSLSEAEAAKAKQEIDDFDPNSLNTNELEKKINEDFIRTNRAFGPSKLLDKPKTNGVK